MEQLSCISWLHGKHSDKIEINTKLPYVAIYDYFAQGDDAEEALKQINQIYNASDCTPLEACEIWASYYL